MGPFHDAPVVVTLSVFESFIGPEKHAVILQKPNVTSKGEVASQAMPSTSCIDTDFLKWGYPLRSS